MTTYQVFGGPLKVEQALQVDQAICCRRRKRTDGQCVRLQTHGRGRAQIAKGIGHIHYVKDISRVDAERQIVMAFRRIPAEHAATMWRPAKCASARAAAAPGVSFFSPNPKVLLNRRFSVNRAGPVPSSIGIPICPGFTCWLKQPYTVDITPGLPHVPSVGRALNVLIPYKSWPVVILKGEPDCATMNGLARRPQGMLIEPPTNARCRTSNDARP